MKKAELLILASAFVFIFLLVSASAIVLAPELIGKKCGRAGLGVATCTEYCNNQARNRGWTSSEISSCVWGFNNWNKYY